MSLWSKLFRTFRPGNHTADIEEELNYHLAMKEQEGSDPRAARVKFGNVSLMKEDTRAQGILVWLECLLRDLRYGLRQLCRTPALTLVVVFSLALGIGANSAIFSLVDAALLKPLPVRNPEALRVIEWSSDRGWPEDLCHMLTGDSNGGPDGPLRGSSIAPRIYRELAAKQEGFAALIGFSDPDLSGVAFGSRAAEQIQLQYVSVNFFQELGRLPQLGRTFSASDDRAGAPPVAIISDRLWRSRFAGQENVLGQTLRVNSIPVQIIGVASPGFFGVQIGEWVDLYTPLSALDALSPRVKLDKLLSEADTYWWVRQAGRLKPGINEGQAIQQASALFQHLVVPENIRVSPGKVPKLVASQGERGFDPVGTDKARALWILLLLVGLILLIVCANVANLLLSRAVVRQRESAVCLALGAGRFRLIRQYLVESLILALAGGALGLFLSHVLAEGIHSFIRSNLNIGGFDLHVDGRILFYTAGLSLVTVLLFGLAPAWQLVRTSVNDALKAHGRTFAAGRLRMPRMLVVLQIGLSLVVLIAAGLLGRSLTNLKTTDIGFNRENLIYVTVNPWSAGYKPEQVPQYSDRFRASLAAIPGVLKVAAIQERPLSGGANATSVNIPGQVFREDDAHAVLINSVSDGLFETLEIPLLAGRTFRAGDLSPKSDAVIVDNRFVERFYSRRNPLGEQFGSGPKPTEQYRIVGVVKNSSYNTLREAPHPVMYRPSSTALWPGFNLNFVIRSNADTRQLAGTIRRYAAAIDPSVPVIEIKTQTALIDHLLLTDRLLSILSSAFGMLALILSAIGLIGLLVYAVARRTNEIGVRMALGASQGDVERLVLGDSFRLVAAGICVGLPGAYLIGRLLKHTLFNLQPADPVTAGLSLAILATVAALSAWLPAHRAAHIDPIVALREE